MLQTLKLLLPALIPSWRFFDTIAPSPRIEFTLFKTAQDTMGSWQEFRPRPAQLPISIMLKRLFYNPYWNESLFLVSCAERLMITPEEVDVCEIGKRITAELEHHCRDVKVTTYMQFRVVFISRLGTEVQKHITFISPVQAYCGKADS